MIKRTCCVVVFWCFCLVSFASEAITKKQIEEYYQAGLTAEKTWNEPCVDFEKIVLGQIRVMKYPLDHESIQQKLDSEENKTVIKEISNELRRQTLGMDLPNEPIQFRIEKRFYPYGIVISREKSKCFMANVPFDQIRESLFLTIARPVVVENEFDFDENHVIRKIPSFRRINDEELLKLNDYLKLKGAVDK